MTVTIQHTGTVWHALRKGGLWAQHHELEPLLAFCRAHGHEPQMVDAENEAKGRQAEAQLRTRLDAQAAADRADRTSRGAAHATVVMMPGEPAPAFRR
jgi:hypothetical protein